MIWLSRFILLLLLAAMAIAAFPFLIASIYIDERGITIPGQVHSKREDVGVQYSAIKHTAEMTVEYIKPDGSGVGFLAEPLTLAEYDAVHIGQPLGLHYLRKEDLPNVRFIRALRNASLLPTVRLASRQTLSPLKLLLTGQAVRVIALTGGIILLLLIWRTLRIPGFIWIAAVCVAAGMVTLLVFDFPRPMPAPATNLRYANGKVKSIDKIGRFFDTNRSRGVDAAQPVAVVGVEFTPEGRNEPIVALDLIDAGSIPGLAEKSSVKVEYELASPRTAYLQGASRHFFLRNIAGIINQGAVYLAVLIVGGGVFLLIGRGYRRLTRRG